MGSTGAPKIGGGGAKPSTATSSGEYTQFNSEPNGTHTYERDDNLTSKWFSEHSNADELYGEVEKNSLYRRAFEAWAEGYFMGGQQYGGFSNMTEREQARTRVYDEILDKAVLHEGVEVHRRATAELLFGKGNKRVTEELLKGVIGKELISEGNMSTGAGTGGLTIGRGYSKPIDYVIQIPKGAKGAGMWIGNPRVNPYWSDQQREFMTNRDIILKPTGYRRLSDAERDEIRRRTNDEPPQFQVVLSYVGRLDKHNYS